MIHVKNINLSFGQQTVFDDISFAIQQNQKIGLVGSNGSGKSTLLKAIANQQLLDSGEISVSGKVTIAYMPQEVVLTSNKTVYQEAYSSFAKLEKLQTEEKLLEKEIQTNSTQELIDRYAHVHEELAHLNPHQAVSDTKKILNGLGFSEEQQSGPVAHLSVGWKMRLVLAKLLLKKADFYLFDEPTNHLDIVAKDWFLEFLKNSSSGFILVCHDRYFLDQLSEEVIALDRGKARRYKGNYSFYEQQWEQDLAALHAAHLQQQRDIKRKTATIERFRAKSSKAKMAKSMQKELDKVELITLPPSAKQVSFSFPDVQRAGRIVLKVHDTAHTFGDKQIFKNVNFQVERGQKIALVAPNGTGKSTLFNLICGKLPLQKGTIELGYNVESALFAQDQNESLNLDATILQNILSCCSDKPEKLIRSFLGSFLFSGDDVKKQARVLSGGEKNRVSMVCVLLQDANFLLLDEPTNHLDIQSKEVLLKALNAYEGTILFVSHDRDFVNKVATDIVELTPNGTYTYQGNYDSFLRQKQQAEKSHQTSSSPKKAKDTSGPDKTNATSDKKKNPELSKQIKKIENKINKLEKKIRSLELKFVDLKYGTPEFKKAQDELETTKKELDHFIVKWEQAQEKMEN